MVFSGSKTLGGAITALMTFSLFVQGAEGSTFGIVPYLNPNVTGTVAGIVGAGGNAGAVIFSILFQVNVLRIIIVRLQIIHARVFSSFYFLSMDNVCTVIFTF